jgi:DNA topoisomerase-3
MRLIICQKPSVARQVLREAHLEESGIQKKGFVEAEDTIVTWMYGHLSVLKYPGTGQREETRVSQLPYDPKQADIVAFKACEEQFAVICSLLDDSSVTEVLWLFYKDLSELWDVESLRRAYGKTIHAKEKVAFYNKVFPDRRKEQLCIEQLFNEAEPIVNYRNHFDAAYVYDAHEKMISTSFSIALSKAYTARYGEEVHFDFSVLEMLILKIVYEKRLARKNNIGYLILYLEQYYQTKVDPSSQYGYYCFPSDAFDYLLDGAFISAKHNSISIKIAPLGQKVYELALEELPAFVSDDAWFKWRDRVKKIMNGKASSDDVLDEVAVWIKEEIRKMPSYPQIENLEVKNWDDDK